MAIRSLAPLCLAGQHRCGNYKMGKTTHLLKIHRLLFVILKWVSLIISDKLILRNQHTAKRCSYARCGWQQHILIRFLPRIPLNIHSFRFQKQREEQAPGTETVRVNPYRTVNSMVNRNAHGRTKQMDYEIGSGGWIGVLVNQLVITKMNWLVNCRVVNWLMVFRLTPNWYVLFSA